MTAAPAVTPRLERTAQPRAFVGNQTTPSTTSAITAGTSIDPAAGATRTVSPALMPAAAAVARDSSARAGLAVAARFSSPSDSRPSSSSSAQVASTTGPPERGGRG